jgi:hypothetical protein
VYSKHKEPILTTQYKSIYSIVYIFHTKLAYGLASSLLATTRQNASLHNPTQLALTHFLSKVTAQCPQTINPHRKTSYAKVEERKVIS